MSVAKEGGGVTTTNSEFKPRCELCRERGEVFYYNVNGKRVCAACFGLAPGEELVRVVREP